VISSLKGLITDDRSLITLVAVEGRLKEIMMGNRQAMVTAMMAAWVGLGVAATVNAADEASNHAV